MQELLCSLCSNATFILGTRRGCFIMILNFNNTLVTDRKNAVIKGWVLHICSISRVNQQCIVLIWELDVLLVRLLNWTWFRRKFARAFVVIKQINERLLCPDSVLHILYILYQFLHKVFYSLCFGRKKSLSKRVLKAVSFWVNRQKDVVQIH